MQRHAAPRPLTLAATRCVISPGTGWRGAAHVSGAPEQGATMHLVGAACATHAIICGHHLRCTARPLTRCAGQFSGAFLFFLLPSLASLRREEHFNKTRRRLNRETRQRPRKKRSRGHASNASAAALHRYTVLGVRATKTYPCGDSYTDRPLLPGHAAQMDYR